MNNLNPTNFYEAQYGETRLVAFEILQKFFDEENEQKIADIFSEILAKNAKKNSLALEDFLEKIDDDLLQQLVVGLVDNIDEIDNIINQYNFISKEHLNNSSEFIPNTIVVWKGLYKFENYVNENLMTKILRKIFSKIIKKFE